MVHSFSAVAERRQELFAVGKCEKIRYADCRQACGNVNDRYMVILKPTKEVNECCWRGYSERPLGTADSSAAEPASTNGNIAGGGSQKRPSVHADSSAAETNGDQSLRGTNISGLLRARLRIKTLSVLSGLLPCRSQYTS